MREKRKYTFSLGAFSKGESARCNWCKKKLFLPRGSTYIVGFYPNPHPKSINESIDFCSDECMNRFKKSSRYIAIML